MLSASNRLLFVVPTPIGNLEDITIRAINVLKVVDIILAEDTRQTSVLLKHFAIEKPLYSHHAFNEHQTIERWIKEMQSGKRIALVSDAGTPVISDPGYLLVRAALESGIEVETLPGATALVPALVNSGLPADRFVFEGFLPHKKGRVTRLKQLAQEERTFILYESPHRLLKTLEQLTCLVGKDRKACVCRELTKLYEENKRGTLQELLDYFSTKPVKGEIVIVVQGLDKKAKKDDDESTEEEKP